ncbi:MAG: hypothetical protein FJZ95_06915, partial [Chloroflexi bacterium]|nr:hypothetical protein [Chloroflexota bacterium]
MYMIDRGVAIVRPKQPLVDWVNRLPDTELKITLDDVKDDCMAVLISPFIDDEDAWEEINELYTDIFETELSDWCVEEGLWPPKRDLETFRKWFDVEIHSTV